MKNIILLLSAVILLTGALRAQPQWVKTGSDKNYPNEFYWTGIGTANGKAGLEQAKTRALSEIASQMKVSVSSKFSTTSTEKAIGGSWSYESDLKTTTESIVDKMELKGARFAETYYSESDGIYYAMAVLDKAEFEAVLRKELDALVSQALNKHENIREVMASKNMGDAVSKLLDLIAFSEPVYAKVIFFNSLFSKVYQMPEWMTSDNMELELYRMLDNISLKIVSGNNQKGRIGAELEKPMRVKVIYMNDGSEEAVKGMTVVFRKGNNVFEKAVSGEDGIAGFKCFVNADMIKSGNSGLIESVVSLPVLKGKLKEKLSRNAFQNFQFDIINSSISTSIEVKGVGSNSAQTGITKKVIMALEKNGAVINQSASEYLTRLVLTASDGGTVDGMAGTMVMQNVEMAVIIIEKSSGRVAGTFNVTSKGLDKDAKSAIEKGISNLKVPNKELSEVLGKISL